MKAAVTLAIPSGPEAPLKSKNGITIDFSFSDRWFRLAATDET